MRCKVYRSLDRPSSFFGIKGRYMTWFLLLAGGALLLALPVALATAGVFGFAFFVLAAAGAYVFILSLQDKASDREFSVRLNARKYPRFYRLKAQPFAALWNRQTP